MDLVYKHLRAGEKYTIIRPFTDLDGHLHPAGEQWVFLGKAFVPYDDAMVFKVQPATGEPATIWLRWSVKNQASIIESPELYIQPA